MSSQCKWRKIKNMGVLHNNNNNTNDIDIDKFNLEFLNIPMPNSNISYYNFTDSSVAFDLNSNGFQFSNINFGNERRSFRGVKSNSIGYKEVHLKFL